MDTKYIRFEGEAGARGVLKLVGAEISGAVTIEQFEHLEHKLNDFRTNPTICRFEAIKILVPIFERDKVDKNSGYIDFEGFHIGQDKLASFLEKYDWAAGNLRKISISMPQHKLDGNFDRLSFTRNNRSLPGSTLYNLYFQDGVLVAVEAKNKDKGHSNNTWNCLAFDDYFHKIFVDLFGVAPNRPVVRTSDGKIISRTDYGSDCRYPKCKEAQVVIKSEQKESHISESYFSNLSVRRTKVFNLVRDHSYYTSTKTGELLWDQYDYSNPVSCSASMLVSTFS